MYGQNLFNPQAKYDSQLTMTKVTPARQGFVKYSYNKIHENMRVGFSRWYYVRERGRWMDKCGNHTSAFFYSAKNA